MIIKDYLDMILLQKIDEIEKSLKNDLTSEEKIKVLEVKIIQAKKNIAKWEEEIKKLRS